VTARLGVAVIGAGHWGANLIRNLAHAEGWDLRWVCDLDEGQGHRALGTRSAVGVTSSLDQVLGDAEVAAVVVSTPADTHAGLATEALRAGKHVMVEKPMASSVDQGETMVALARERDLVLMCDHTYCYTPSARHIRSLIRAGAIGRVHYVDSVRINLGLVQPDVDVFWDLAPHDLSILDFILPDDIAPTAVAAHGADPIGAGRACIGYITLPLSGGGVAHSHVNWLSPTKVRRTIIGGSAGMIVWDDLNPTERVRVYDKSVSLASPPTADERRDARVSYRLGDMVAPALPEEEALAVVVGEFRSAIVERRPPLTGGEAGLRLLRVLEAVTTSLDCGGGLVPLDPYR
jgi:predicted dehydrogenase